MRLIGVMRLCDEFIEEIDLTVSTLAANCDQVCFVLDKVNRPEILAAIDRCANVAGVKENEITPWNHYYTWDDAYHFADSFGADWVIQQDQDELLPWAQLRAGIQRMHEDGNDTLVLSPIHCWGSPNRVVWPRLNRTGNHARVSRGKNPDFTVCHGGGCCIPGSPHRSFYWPYCYRHLAFMTPASRERRLKVPQDRASHESWSLEEPPTFPWREDWSYDRWLELEL